MGRIVYRYLVMPPHERDLWVTFAVAARLLGVSRARVTQLADAGKLGDTRVGGGVKVLRRAAVEEYIGIRNALAQWRGGKETA